MVHKIKYHIYKMFINVYKVFADKLLKGSYRLVNDVGTDEDDKVIGKRADIVSVYADSHAKDNVMGQDVFEVIHDKTKDVLLVTVEDIEEA